MLDKQDYLSIGLFSKTHGNDGDIIVKTNVSIVDYLDDIDFIFADIENGLVPYRINKYSIRNSEMIQFSLSSLESEKSAKELVGVDVYIDSKLVEFEEDLIQSQLQIDQYKVFDKKSGLIGIVNSLISIDKNPLIQILIDKKEILIPFNEDFIVDINHEEKEIYMDLPEGLLDINL